MIVTKAKIAAKTSIGPLSISIELQKAHVARMPAPLVAYCIQSITLLQSQYTTPSKLQALLQAVYFSLTLRNNDSTIFETT